MENKNNLKQKNSAASKNKNKTTLAKKIRQKTEDQQVLNNSLTNIQATPEKQKQAEILDGGNSKISRAFTRNIVVAFLVLLFGFLSVASVAISGNIKPVTVISANQANTRVAQAKLAELGYFEGIIDGVFDTETIDAIKNYQKDNNLTQTGSLDQATATAIGVTDNTQANTDLYLLAKLIHSEARGEPYEGQVAVGAVVLNRVDDAGFPNTLQGVIYQPWAFTALHDGQFNLEPNSTSYQAAQDALNGWDPTYGCLYYYNPVTATSSWIFSRTTIVTIGRHVFCI